MSPLHIRKKVRFSEEAVEKALNPELQDSKISRQTLLPEADSDDWRPSKVEDEAAPSLRRPKGIGDLRQKILGSMQKYHRIEGGVGFEFAMRHAGPIKSTAPDFAAAVRALHRKKIDDLKVGERLELSLPDDLTVAEEEDEEELRFNDDGIPIEPFNMKAEQWSGYFDADGNYLAYRNQDDTDAWLETLPTGPTKVLAPPAAWSEESCRQIDKDNVENRPQMCETDRLLLRQRILQFLQSEETVLDALRRLGTSDSPTGYAGGTKAARHASMLSRLAGTVPAENRQKFDALTEDASQLLNAGDAGVYTRKREELIRDLETSKESQVPYKSEGAHGPSVERELDSLVTSLNPEQLETMDVDNAALEGCFRAVDPEADMFADSSQGPGNNIMETDDGRYMEQGSASGTVGKLIQEENTDVAPSKEVNGAQQFSENMGGFEYDEGSGMYYNTTLGCYFDTKQQLYGDASSGQWFSFEGGRFRIVSTSKA